MRFGNFYSFAPTQPIPNPKRPERKKGEGRIASGLRAVKASFSHTPQSLKMAWRCSPSASTGIAVLTIFSAILPLGIAYTGKLIVDAVIAHSQKATLDWVLVEVALIAVQALVQRLLFLMRSLLGAKLGTDVNVRILDKALELELRHFEDAAFYDRLTRARREASSRPVAMVTDSLQLVQNLLTLLGYATLLIAFSSWTVLALVLAALPATLVEMRFSSVAFRVRNWRSADSRRLNYLEYVIANDAHAKEVKMLEIGPELLRRYRTLSEAFYVEDKKLSIRRSGWAYALSLLATGVFYACYGIMALSAARGTMTLGNLTLYVMAFRQGQQAFQSCLTAIGSMYEHNLYMSNLFGYFAIDTNAKSPIPETALAINAGVAANGIRFENVGFKYPGRDDWALRNLFLEIPSQKSLALVGHNGAGKSTFIKLLCRLYEPTEGRITLDGIDLKNWPAKQLRARISVVFQDFNKYQFSLRENVGLGSLGDLADEGRVQRAVENGGAKPLVESLSDGLATPLGRWFVDGVELSGGQWQKIALARAFMREQADILILDEPTAALDAEAEQAVFERFALLTKGRTSILISHRFPTVRMAEKIVVLEGGTLREQGTHDELLALKGRYAQLFALQAQGYA